MVWRGMRRQFMRRIALFFAAFVGFMFLLGFLASQFFGDHDGRREGPPFPFPFFWVFVVVLVALFVGGWLRRTAGPVADVMEAADRVAAGHYAARVTERGSPDIRRLARAFNKMAERLESDEARRRELLADVAHEVRTPLSVIRGDLEGMLDGVYPADPAHLLPVVEQTRVMTRLLEDLLTLSTAEAGSLRLHTEQVAAAALVEDAVRAFAARAGAAGVRLDTLIDDGLPDLEVDRVRIGEVFANLLTNALRHTPPGGTVTVSAASPGTDGVTFTVEDTGEGILAADLPHVFDRFVRVRDPGGSGLGLTIARSLVVAHGGSIEAESERGRGTSIRFTIPAAPTTG